MLLLLLTFSWIDPIWIKLVRGAASIVTGFIVAADDDDDVEFSYNDVNGAAI